MNFSLAFLGGTGRLGSGLAQRFLSSGFKVHIGSRTAYTNNRDIYDYATAVELSDIIFLTIPFPYSRDIAYELKDKLIHKILVDTSVPISNLPTPVSVSAVVSTQNLLGNSVKVVSAFQTLPASWTSRQNSGTILVAGDDYTSCDTVIKINQQAGFNSIYCGELKYSLVSENIAITLMQINRHYQIKTGIRIIE